MLLLGFLVDVVVLPLTCLEGVGFLPPPLTFLRGDLGFMARLREADGATSMRGMVDLSEDIGAGFGICSYDTLNTTLHCSSASGLAFFSDAPLAKSRRASAATSCLSCSLATCIFRRPLSALTSNRSKVSNPEIRLGLIACSLGTDEVSNGGKIM